MWYKYWTNKDQWHGSLMFKCQAKTISEADKLFEAETGIDPCKAPWIGCQPIRSGWERIMHKLCQIFKQFRSNT